MKFIEERASRTKRLKRLEFVSGEPSVEVTKRSMGRGNAYQRTKTGYRSDIDIVARSGWEANVARVFEAHGVKWEFEPKTFVYPIKRGTKAYLPDFYLPKTKEWIEVKGWFDKRSQTKIKRFKKYYPDEFSRLILIIGRSDKGSHKFCKDLGIKIVLDYQDLSDNYKDRIATWEGA